MAEVGGISLFKTCFVTSMLKSMSGNYSVQCQEDVPSALEALKDRPLYAEQWVDFKTVLDHLVPRWRTFLMPA